MTKRAKVLGLAFGLIVLTLGIVTYNLGYILSFICDGKDKIAEVRLNNKLVVIISAERCEENERAIYYEVKEVGREAVVPTTYLSNEDPDYLVGLSLKVLSNEDGTLYGVVEQRLPQKVWLLYSVAGETWPRCESGGYEVCEEKGEALLRELQKAHPEINLTF